MSSKATNYKYLTLEDYMHSANADKLISHEKEMQMIAECITFIQKMALELQITKTVCCTALNIFHIYQKKFPFTDFDRFMVATLCVFIAAKIDYYNAYRYEKYIEHYYLNKKGPKRKNEKPFEEVKDKLKEDFVDQEFKIMNTIQFDFDFDLPLNYIKYHFQRNYYDSRIKPHLQSLKLNESDLKDFEKQWEIFIGFGYKFILDSYLQPYCVYFPAPIIAAACILLSAQFYNYTYPACNFQDR